MHDINSMRALFGLLILCLLPAVPAAAGDSFVQAKSAVNFGASTVSMTWDHPTKSGNVIAYYVWWNDVAAKVVGVSDSVAGELQDSGVGQKTLNNAHAAQMFYKENIRGGGTSMVTIRFTVLPTTEAIGCHEIAGRAGANALREAQWHTQNFAGTDKDFITSAPVMAGPGDYVFAGTHAQFGSEATAGTRFILRTKGSNHVLTESLTVDHGGQGNIVGAFTPSDNDGFVTGIMTFKASGDVPHRP
jgi:hypothetical protein